MWIYSSYDSPFYFFQGYEGSLLKVTSKNGKTASVSNILDAYAFTYTFETYYSNEIHTSILSKFSLISFYLLNQNDPLIIGMNSTFA